MDRAYDSFRAAAEAYAASAASGASQIGWALWNASRILSERGEHKAARRLLDEIEDNWRDSIAEDARVRGPFYSSVTENRLALGDLAEAERYADRAHSLLVRLDGESVDVAIALALTANTQPAILTASIAVLRALEEDGPLPVDVMAGHSLGEYSAHVAAGTLAAWREIGEQYSYAVRSSATAEDLLQAIFAFCYARQPGPGWREQVLRLLDIFIDGSLVASLTAANASGNIFDFGGGSALAQCVQADGHQFYCDTLVDWSKTFAHTGSTLTLGWQASGAGWQAGDDESWGVDNIRIDYFTRGGGVPEPAAWAMMLAGFGIVGGAMRRRTKIQFA